MSDRGSLAYRRHAGAIHDGHVPEKYTRLLPYITGSRILELGTAEGVLALTLADRDPTAEVTGVEFRPDRYQSALALRRRWRALGRQVDGCRLVLADIRDRMDLLTGVETLVAVRMIYYLRESLHDVFTAVGQAVPCVVLCGNGNRAKKPDEGINYYAGIPGMSEVLTRAGYRIDTVVAEGDPIVVGRR